MLLHDLLLTAKLFKSDVYGSLSSVSIKGSRDKNELALLSDVIWTLSIAIKVAGPDLHLSQEPLLSSGVCGVIRVERSHLASLFSAEPAFITAN